MSVAPAVGARWPRAREQRAVGAPGATRSAAAPVPGLTGLGSAELGPVRRFLVRRPGVVDAGVVLVFTGWAVFTGVGADSMYGLGAHLGAQQVQRMQVASLVLTAAGALTLTRRRGRPALTAAVVGVLGVLALAATGATSGFELGLALALYALAARERPVVTWVVTGATVVALLAAARVLPLPLTVNALVLGADPAQAGGLEAVERRARGDALFSVVWAQTAVPVLVLALLAVAVGTSVRNRRMHVARILEAADALGREQEQRLRLAQAGERARIAREMHDIVAHSVSVMIALGHGASVALDHAPERSRAALEDLVATGRSALGDMRRILGVLHEDGTAPLPSPAAPPAGDPHSAAPAAPMQPQPGGPDLDALLEGFRRAGLPVRATVSDRVGREGPEPLEELDANLGLAVYRIVQESLTNALRHAGGTAGVEVRVLVGDEHVEVVVTDAGARPGDGPGPGTGPGSQRGLVGLRERAAAFGGTLEAGPHGTGWRVRARLARNGAGT